MRTSRHDPASRKPNAYIAPSPQRQYNRARDLPRLLPLWPDQLGDFSLEGREQIVRLLHSQLRRERRRALAADWTYSLPRHRQLLIAYRAEAAALRKSAQTLGKTVPA